MPPGSCPRARWRRSWPSSTMPRWRCSPSTRTTGSRSSSRCRWRAVPGPWPRGARELRGSLRAVSRSASCTCPRRWMTATWWRGRSTPRVGPPSPPRCGWPRPRTMTVSPAPRPPVGAMPWWRCAGSSSTTSTTASVAVTDRISTWWSTSRRWRRGGGVGSSTDRPSTGRACRPCCVIRPSTGSSPPDGRPSSTTGHRRERFPRPCGAPWSSGTSTAGSPDVTVPRPGARGITSGGSPTGVQRS
ncbi:MAG: hypothetical protein QOE93_2211 [Actinomycetota bacterium]|nr:hypothetical protein [Actinomycetota bacterium]